MRLNTELSTMRKNNVIALKTAPIMKGVVIYE